MSSTTTVTSTVTRRHQPQKAVYKDSLGRNFVPPNFTIKQILDAIPAHCFQRSTVRSLSYVLRDLLLVATLGYAASLIHLIPFVAARVLAWTLYGIAQGMVMTGIWILAHECGHRAFSSNNTINDTVGWVLHSALFVPYHSWRISHSKHHKATGNMEQDMVFVPKTETQYHTQGGYRRSEQGLGEWIEETPIANLVWLVAQQLFGWPLYLFTDVTGHAWPKHIPHWKINHFNPQSPIFNPKDWNSIFVSDLGILLAGYCLYQAISQFGFANVALYYLMPYVWVNHWLVAITYLQHTDPALPHYSGETWTFVRGAACTIDREFGFIGRHIFHGIIEYHVAHHFASRIPHYHGEEATAAVQKVLGPYYMKDNNNFLTSLWRIHRDCRYVDNEGDVRFFRSPQRN